MKVMVIRRGSVVKVKLEKGLKGWVRMRRTKNTRKRERESERERILLTDVDSKKWSMQCEGIKEQEEVK